MMTLNEMFKQKHNKHKDLKRVLQKKFFRLSDGNGELPKLGDSSSATLTSILIGDH